jgi:glycosyltransferase involved in cell wall biosynthesis
MLNNNHYPPGHKLKTNPLVSVVMPSFKHGEFIEAACRSVLAQAYRPLRLFVIDGGSTDGTLRTLDSLQQEFGARLHWISEPDSGPANAINKGLQAVEGDIIGWLNADDLYADGCVQIIVDYFVARPDSVMAYGEAENMDVCGNVLGRYPTLPPTVPLAAFQKGCFICQPTVFMRRELLDVLGLLDESLKTAFDFDLWLRTFRQFPHKVGYIDRVQAFSRIHVKTITASQRMTVACEGVRVLARHLGSAETHWMQNYLTEACETFPSYADKISLLEHIDNLLDEVGNCFDPPALENLKQELASDMRLRVVPPGIHANIFPDGWAGKQLSLRIRIPTCQSVSFVLRCEHWPPKFMPLNLEISTSWGEVRTLRIARQGDFDIVVECPTAPPGTQFTVDIVAQSTFMPSQIEQGSTDRRRLAYRLKKIDQQAITTPFWRRWSTK